MPPPIPPSGQYPQPPDARRTDPPSLSRRPMPTLPEPKARRETTLIWIQTVLLGLICAGILVMINKIMDPKTLGEKIAPLFANLVGASLLVGLMQLIRGKAWPWPLVGFVILLLAFLGMQLTLWVAPHLGIKPG
jgi:ABC-type uncharacterized transport system permease subunit